MRVPFSFKNLQSIKPKKISIAFYRPPTRIGMMFEDRKLDLLNRPLIGRRRARVIHDPVPLSIWRHARRAQENHHVIRKLLDPGLIEEKQIAGFGFPPISAHKNRIEILERATIGEFGESPVSQIALMKRSEISAKDFFSQRIVIEVEAGDIRRHSFVARAHLLKPKAIVTPQRFTNCEAHQSRPVALLDLPLIAQLIELHLRDCREPATEVVAIPKRAEFDSVGDAVVIRVN